VVVIPASLSNHSPSFCLGAKKGHILIHSAYGRALECSRAVTRSGDNIQSSVSTRILIYYHFTYT
jgi:hypothetical protein